MLIRQKITNLNDEYNHVDPVGMFGVLTDASGNVLRNYVYDAFSDAPYKRQYVGESFPSQSNHTGTCQTALSEPGILTGNGGRGVVVPSRGFQVLGNKAVPVVVHACSNSGTLYQVCMLLCQIPKYIACKPLGPIFGRICKWTAHIYCEHYCKNLVKWKPFGKCAQACSTAPTAQYEDYCNYKCYGQGAR